MSLTPTGFPSGGVFPTGFPGAGGPGGVSISGNTAGTTGLISTGTLILDGGNNITLSQSGNTITIVGGAGGGGGGINLSLSGNTSGTLTLISSGTAILAGGNNITLSQVGQSVTISAFNQTVQTQNLVDVSLSGNTAGVLALVSSGTLILAGGNNVTLSQNGQSVTISAFTQTVQTQNVVDLSLSGNTAGALALISSGTGILAGGNNITLSQNAQSITISAANQTVQTQNLIAASLSGNTAGALALVSSGTLILAGGNNITLSQNGQSVTISNGEGTLSQWWAGPNGVAMNTSLTNNNPSPGTLLFWPVQMNGFFSASQANEFISMSISTSGTNNSTLAGTLSFLLAVYTKNVSTLSLASSGSVTYAFSETSNVNSSLWNSARLVSIPINVNFTPGDYWLGAVYNTSSSGQLGYTMSMYAQYLSLYPNGLFGAAIPFASSFQPLLGFGAFSSSTAALPSSAAFSSITGNVRVFPVVNFINYTA